MFDADVHCKQDQFCMTGAGEGQPRWRTLEDGFEFSFDRGFLDAPDYVPQGSHSMHLIPLPGFAPMLRTSLPREVGER
jgi:hypothetical protein